MALRTVAVYLSEHGFGHAVRGTMLLEGLLARGPDVDVALATRLPAWHFQRLPRTERHEPMALPPPVMQQDSLTVDHEATAALLRGQLRAWQAEVDRHARWLQQIGAGLVYCDVPALPLEAAAAAGIPGVALGNFTWDWIYQQYGDVDPVYCEAAERMASAYAAAQLYLRTPPSPAEPTTMPTEDIPWVVRHAREPQPDVRRALSVPSGMPLVLLSFGGHPSFPVQQLADSEFARRVWLVAGRQLAPAAGNIHLVNEDGLAAEGIEYLDIVNAADVVVSKPGYCTIADCLATRTRLVYLARPEFPEAAILEPLMQRELGAVGVPPDRRMGTAIARAVDEALSRPPPAPSCRLDGVEQAVERLTAWLGR